ncbi:MAG: response regulator [Acidobacteria bacterium]|nr:response regulator [Acidobacteriota bacterium]
MDDAKKILVVDDNRTIKMLLEKRLSAEGYLVVTAGDGREGLAAAAREMPDLILSDVDMPIMDGGEMVSKLKASIRTSRIPVIFLTSLITKDEDKRPASGDNWYISKMAKPAELLVAIRERLALPPK